MIVIANINGKEREYEVSSIEEFVARTWGCDHLFEIKKESSLECARTMINIWGLTESNFENAKYTASDGVRTVEVLIAV